MMRGDRVARQAGQPLHSRAPRSRVRPQVPGGAAAGAKAPRLP